jgi:hypothetical protein
VQIVSFYSRFIVYRLRHNVRVVCFTTHGIYYGLGMHSLAVVVDCTLFSGVSDPGLAYFLPNLFASMELTSPMTCTITTAKACLMEVFREIFCSTPVHVMVYIVVFYQPCCRLRTHQDMATKDAYTQLQGDCISNAGPCIIYLGLHAI